MAGDHFKHYGRDAKEMRLLPKNKPKTIRDAMIPQMQGIIKKIMDSLGDIVARGNVGENVQVESVSDFYKLAQGYNALAKSQIEIERWEFEKTRRIEDIAEMIGNELKRELSARPDLYAELRPLIDQAAENVKEQITPREDEQPVIDVASEGD